MRSLRLFSLTNVLYSILAIHVIWYHCVFRRACEVFSNCVCSCIRLNNICYKLRSGKSSICLPLCWVMCTSYQWISYCLTVLAKKSSRFYTVKLCKNVNFFLASTVYLYESKSSCLTLRLIFGSLIVWYILGIWIGVAVSTWYWLCYRIRVGFNFLLINSAFTLVLIKFMSLIFLRKWQFQ